MPDDELGLSSAVWVAFSVVRNDTWDSGQGM